MNALIKLVILWLIFFCFSAYPEVYIKVTGANIKKAKFALGNLQSLPENRNLNDSIAESVFKQIQEDLEFLNLFDSIPRELFASLDGPQNFNQPDYSEWSRIQASFFLKLGYQLDGGKLILQAILYDIPGQKKIFNFRSSSLTTQYVRLVHVLTEKILSSVTGEKGLFSSRILMVCRIPGNIRHAAKEIYISDPDGKNLIALTSDRTLSLSPSWAPNGKLITYTQYQFEGRGRNRKKLAILKTHDLRTGKRKKISWKPGMNSGSSWSPDGKTIAATLSFSGRPEIYFLDPNLPHSPPQPLSRTIQWRRISGTGFDPNALRALFDVEPNWSPDGKKLVISSARTGHPMIYIVDLATKEATQLTFAGTYNSSPSWSPLGDKILFAAQMTDLGNFDLFVIDTDGNNLSRLTAGGRKGKMAVNYENPSFAPTGRHFAYSNNESGRYEIFVSTLDWTIKRKISPPGMECTTPAWGPAEN